MPNYRPESLDKAFFAMRADPKCIPFAGGLSFKGIENEHYLYLENVPELDKAHNREDCIGTGIGAMMTLERLMEIKSIPMILRRAAVSVPQEIRKKATVGGSVCALDKKSDIVPVLAALGASVVVRTRVTEKVVPLAEFYKGNKVSLPTGALVTAVIVPYDNFTNASFEKRFDKDNNQKVSVTGLAKTTEGIVREMRVAIGGISDVPIVVEGAQAEAVGKTCAQIKASREGFSARIAEQGSVSNKDAKELIGEFLAKL